MENHSIIVNACTTFSSSLTFLNVSKELATISGLAVNLIHGILIHNPKVLLRGENRLSNFDFGINNLEMRKCSQKRCAVKKYSIYFKLGR